MPKQRIVILGLVGMTILAFGTADVVLRMGYEDPPCPQTPQFAADFDQVAHENGTSVVVRHLGGDTVDPDNLIVSVAGSNLTGNELGLEGPFTANDTISVDQLAPKQTVKVYTHQPEPSDGGFGGPDCSADTRLIETYTIK